MTCYLNKQDSVWWMVGQEIEERNKILCKIFRFFFFPKLITNNATSGEKKKKAMTEFDPQSQVFKDSLYSVAVWNCKCICRINQV